MSEAHLPVGRSPRRWLEADDAELRRLVAARVPVAGIARAMGRTVDAVRGRAQVLGIGLTPRLRPWRSDPRRQGGGD